MAKANELWIPAGVGGSKAGADEVEGVGLSASGCVKAVQVAFGADGRTVCRRSAQRIASLSTLFKEEQSLVDGARATTGHHAVKARSRISRLYHFCGPSLLGQTPSVLPAGVPVRLGRQ